MIITIAIIVTVIIIIVTVIIIIVIIVIIFSTNAHVMPLILPPILKLLPPDPLSIPMLPYPLPDRLAHDTHRFGPVLAHLRLQRRRPRRHLPLRQLADIPRRPTDDVRVAHLIQTRQVPVVHGPAELVRDAGLVQQLPETIGRVRVRVPGGGRRDAWVEADEDAEQVRLHDVGELLQVRVLGWIGIGGGFVVVVVVVSFYR